MSNLPTMVAVNTKFELGHQNTSKLWQKVFGSSLEDQEISIHP
jgi:hypothetical protein